MQEREHPAKRGGGGRPLTRRQFLAATGGVATLGLIEWIPTDVVPAGGALSTLTAPPGFPHGIPLYQQAFENWSEEIVLEGAWTCAPRTAADVVRLANWASTADYQVRARGKMHSWSPLSVPVGSNGAGLVLADATRSLTALSINTETVPASVTVQAGVTMDQLLEALEVAGLGLTAHPAPGDVTIGGVLAVDAHGAAIPAVGEERSSGHTYGSLSNLVLSLTAVVWDVGQNSYALRTFERSDPAIAPLLTHLGRTFITEVKLQVGANSRLRCQSFTDIPAWELLGAPGSSPRTFDRYVNQSGRAEIIWYPFTDAPWLKVWSVAPERPPTSRAVTAPYNYTFSNVEPAPVSNLAKRIFDGDPSVTPDFGLAEVDVTKIGLAATDTADIWGWSKDLLLYVKPSTLRFTANGCVVITDRASIQRVVNDFATYYQGLMAAYQANEQFPINGPVEIRVTGLDVPEDVDLPGAVHPQLSALRPRPDHPEWDVAVWIDVLTMPGTPLADQFYREFEQWFFGHFTGWAAARIEWSKGWAYSPAGAWTDPIVLSDTIPNAFRAGQAVGDNWDAALAGLNALDPHRVFSNAFLNELLP